MADVLLELILKKDPRKIKIKEITGLASIDRQTFYYHFTDIYDLAAYTYKRGVARLFGCNNIEDTYPNYDSSYCTEIMHGLAGTSPGQKELAVFMHGQNPRGQFYTIVRRNILAEATNVNFFKGIPEEKRSFLLDVLTSAHVAVLVGWLQGEYSASSTEMDLILKKKHEAIFSAFRFD
jgi:AcrR family transcriptional regulator